jgi:hypothetical protein
MFRESNLYILFRSKINTCKLNPLSNISYDEFKFGKVITKLDSK